MSKTLKIVSGVMLILSILMAGYMMINHMGIIDGLNFGAGAYYYADIPEFDRYVKSDVYESPVSFYVIALLFLAWGAIVYKLWIWIDSKQHRPTSEI